MRHPFARHGEIGCALPVLVSLFFLIAATGCSISRPSQQPLVIMTSSATTLPTAAIAITKTPRALPTPSVLPTLPPLVVGVPYGIVSNTQELARWQEWTQRLSQATGLSLTVQPNPPTDMELLEAMKTGKIHLALLSPWMYTFGHERGWVEPGPMINQNNQDGAGIMFVARVDSGLKPGEPPKVFEQLSGKRPCYAKQNPQLPTVPPLEEFILPAGLLAVYSVDVGLPVFVEAGKSVAAGVFRKECDFAALRGDQPEKFLELIPAELGSLSPTRWAQEMQVLYVTPAINPVGLFAFSPVLSPTQRDQLNRAILSAPIPWAASYNQLTAFKEPIYTEFARIVAAAGVDIQIYLNAKSEPSEATASGVSWKAPPSGTAVVDVPLQGGAPFLPFWGTQTLNRLVLPAIYAELVRLDANGTYFPYLAASLPTLQNGLVRFIGSGEDEQFEVEFQYATGPALARWSTVDC